MRAILSSLVVMIIVVADRVVEVCFLLRLVRTFPSALVGPRRRSQVQPERGECVGPLGTRRWGGMCRSREKVHAK